MEHQNLTAITMNQIRSRQKTKTGEKNPKSREMCNQCQTNKSHETAKDMPGAPHHLKGSAKRITGIENLSEKQKIYQDQEGTKIAKESLSHKEQPQVAADQTNPFCVSLFLADMLSHIEPKETRYQPNAWEYTYKYVYVRKKHITNDLKNTAYRAGWAKHRPGHRDTLPRHRQKKAYTRTIPGVPEKHT